jgi:hypothetical protein
MIRFYQGWGNIYKSSITFVVVGHLETKCERTPEKNICDHEERKSKAVSQALLVHFAQVSCSVLPCVAIYPAQILPCILGFRGGQITDYEQV